jgi:hypothetical protein
VGIFIEVIYTFTAIRNSQKRRKTDGFAHVLAYKSPKTPFFAPKYLTTYTHETFFEEYTNFEAHYLSRFGVISVQSFGSHIRPQPHGLGLRIGQSAYSQCEICMQGQPVRLHFVRSEMKNFSGCPKRIVLPSANLVWRNWFRISH